MILRVHPLTYHTLVTEYGSDQIILTPSHLLVPLLVFKPHCHVPKGMTKEISLIGDSTLLASIHERAGANLYELHMDKIVQYMCRAVDKEEFAEIAMKEYYKLIGMEIDDLDYGTVYKRWQRHVVKKNRQNIVTKRPYPVLRKSQPPSKAIESCLETAARVISDDFDRYMSPDGRPIPHMLLKAIIYSMAVGHGWKQIDVAEYLGRHRWNVSYHLKTFLHRSHAAPVLRD